MNRLLYIVMLFSILTSCSKDNAKSDNENPHSKKRPSKITISGEDRSGVYVANYHFHYEGNKLIQIKLSVSSRNYTQIYNQDYNFRYSGDTVIMTTKDEGGTENYSYEHKYLIDENRMAVYTKSGTTYHSPNGEMRWSSSSDVFLLRNGRIEEHIETGSWGDQNTTRFIYTGDKLIQKNTEYYYGDTRNISYKYKDEIIYISYDSGPYYETGKIKNGKLIKWENYEFHYTSEGLVSEIEFSSEKTNYFYENGSANLEFLKLDFDNHFEFTLDPLFSFFYW